MQTQTILSNIRFFKAFPKELQGAEIPAKFTYPFYYVPHPLAVEAAELLQDYLKTQTEWSHNFGLDPSDKRMVIGKMFGVLVVQKGDELGYLWAFSGKLADCNHFERFVPPIYDTLKKESFFQKGQEILNQINDEIESLENDLAYSKAKYRLDQLKEEARLSITSLNKEFKLSRKRRKTERELIALSQPQRLAQLKKLHEKISLEQQADLKYLRRIWNYKVFYAQVEVDLFEDKISSLRTDRKSRSNALQDKIFNQYNFLNSAGEGKNVRTIFADTIFKKPPSGAGECATPKLLQYAFQHELKPIAMAEFWWGASPKSEIRKHKQFYPACRGKCEPILSHMLNGIQIEDNPLQKNPAIGKKLEIIFEDDHMLVVNKPEDFLSVPGKIIKDSVWLRIKKQFPKITGPIIVHRLDMSTSGIMILAKTKEAHKILQRQFIKRQVKKRYNALLSGELIGDKGTIELPLCLDIHNRPQQMVDYENGKSARTQWMVVERNDGCTRVHFYPESGRTHQLRVHAAHVEGLNAPIIGDDLYGTRGNRLYLHAEEIQLAHPISREIMTFQSKAPF